MTANRFEGKTALITGSSQGIGRGIALALAAEGADIILNYRSGAGAARRTAEEIKDLGRKTLICQADVSQRDQVWEMFREAEKIFQRIDIVVANAAYSKRARVVEAEWSDVLQTIEVSQFGVFHTCQFAAQHMIKQELTEESRGKIILISSILAEHPPPENAAYNMSKAAVNALGETLAAELTEHRVNVNIINPGLIDTPGERKYATEDQLRATAARIPWQRLGTIADVGKAVVYLASSDANYVTGSTLRVDGGFLLGLQLPPVQK
ncbi:MAG: SDR family oxidoreductase [Anaerolineales bacterium]|nr:SDR family oxidoreductase [Anaerolineales bacterium]